MQLEDGQFVAVQSFMTRDLKLTGNELLIYAVIYGFSQDGQSWFKGSRKYLALWTNSTTRSVTTYLKKLEEKGYIQRRTFINDGQTLNAYRATRPLEKSSRGVKNLLGGVEKVSTNNIEDISTTTTIKERFNPPTLAEVTAYVKEKGYNFNPERFIAYYESNGWKVGRNPMKSWKAAATTWGTSNDGHRNKEVQQRDYSEYK